VPKAKTLLASLQQTRANTAEVFNLAALTALAGKQNAVARASFDRALQIEPKNLEALAGRARLDLAEGHATEATGRLAAVLNSGEPSVDLLLLGARTNWSAGNLAESEKLLQRALAADPSRLQTYALLGELYAKQNRIDEAIARFQDVLKQSPKSSWAITMLGMLREAQGKKSEAAAEYERALAIDPRSAVPANNLAWLYVESNRNLDQALQLAQTAQQTLPQEAGVTDTLGWIYVRKNMASLGIPHLEASIRRSPSEALFHYHLGMAYLQVNEFDKAREELTKALSLRPNFEGAADARKALSSIKG